MHSPYKGYNGVVIGNGNGLGITHTGNLCLSSSLIFPDSLCVPTMTKNLVFVSKLCQQNDVNVIFSMFGFQVTDRRTGAILLTRPHKNGVYHWPGTTYTPSALSSVTTSASLWHSRLGQPSSKVLSHLLKTNLHSLSFGTLSSLNCVSCHVNKSHKLPFAASSLTSSRALELFFFLTYGRRLFTLLMVLSIMSSLWIILPNIYGFILLNKNLTYFRHLSPLNHLSIFFSYHYCYPILR